MIAARLHRAHPAHSSSTAPWTDERIRLASDLWNEGFSASQVAKKIGGVTRNSVIGKMYRLGLTGRAKPSDPKLREPYPERRAPVKSAGSKPALIFGPGYSSEPKPPRVHQLPPSLQALNDASLQVRLLDLTRHHCRYITHGEGAGALFCGAVKREGSSYCDGHHAVCNSGVPKRIGVTPDFRPLRGRPMARRTMEAA